MIFTLAQGDAKPGDTLKDAAAKKGAAPKGEKPAEKAESGGEASANPQAAGTTTMQSTGDAWYEQGALGLMGKGGFFMWPILILGVLAAGVIIERIRSLRMLGTDTAALRREVQELLAADRAEDALGAVNREEGPVPAILGAGLRKYVLLRKLNYDAGKIQDNVVKAMEDYGVHIVAALERHLPILATVSSVAPMIGFLGTVQGMIVSFDAIEAGIGKENIVKLAAGGIKVALLTTCFGLIVGIPAYMAYNYFTGLINRFVLDIEETASELIENVTLQGAIESGATALGSTEAATR
jgi:biopolymer transport protein ExbB